VARLVATRPGNSAPGREQLFTENGSAFYYEYLPHRQDGGLIEGATPECRGPGQLLLYQRAQEALLEAALPIAGDELEAVGFPGELGLLKNSRDAEGHVYGGQENYEAEVARGPALFFYRLGLLLLLPVVAVMTVVSYLTVAAMVVVGLLALVVAIFVPAWRRRLTADDTTPLANAFGRVHLWMIVVLTWPVVTPFALLLRLTAFRRVRRQLLPFLVTRPAIAGCGSVAGDRRFRLAEKAPAVRRVSRLTILPGDRPIFDTGNLMKMICAPLNLQIRPVFHLFRRRQRLQLGVADSNRAQVAEYLKVGTTALLLDLIEGGHLDDAPRLRRPVAALHAVADDPELAAPVELADGTRRTALEIQRFYLERARRHLHDAPAARVEDRQVVRLWGEALDALEAGDLGALVGRLDWVTKRFLLERCGADADDATLKTLDLRYHELGDGYFARLEQAGESAELVGAEAVRRAVREPPEDTPAFFRGRLIRRQAGVDTPIVVSWDSARIGRPFLGKVLPFRR